MNESVTIKTPIWKSRAFGVADFRLKGDGYIDVKCEYRIKSGELLYPDTYRIDKKKALTYPSIWMGNHKGREIPIDDFTVVHKFF